MEQVNDSIKKERVNIILELSDELENKYYNKFLNKDIEVLVKIQVIKSSLVLFVK